MRPRKILRGECRECGKEVLAITRLEKQAFYKKAIYCCPAHGEAWRARRWSESFKEIATRNREAISRRMRENNPMANAVTRKKVSDKLKEMGHKPKIQGGNGRGFTEPQIRVKTLLPQEWVMEYAVPMGKGAISKGLARSYKLDLALPEKKLGVEINGASHCSPKGRMRDAKKKSALESIGWKVLSFTNREVMENPQRVVKSIMSMT